MSLRTLILGLLTPLLCLVALLLAVLYPALLRKDCRSKIERLGGEILEVDGLETTGLEKRYWQGIGLVLGEAYQPIRHVILRAAGASDQELRFLTKLPELQVLQVSYSDNSDALFVPIIKQATGLRVIQFHGTRAGDGTAAALLGLSRPFAIGLQQTQVSTNWAARLKTHTSYFEWSDSWSETLHQQLKILSGEEVLHWEPSEAMPSFRTWVNLDEANKQVLETLSSFTANFHTLLLQGQVTPEHAAFLAQTPRVRMLMPYQLKTDSLDWISGWTQLEYLELRECEIGADAWRIFEHLPPSLRSLSGERTAIRAEDFARLPADSGLRSITWQGPIGDAGCAALCRLKKLEALQLNRATLTDASLPLIASRSALTYLDLNHNAISDQGVAQLAALKKLERLHLKGTDISDAVVATLELLPALIELDLEETALTLDGYRQVIALPGLKILNVGGGTTALDVDGIAVPDGLNVYSR